MGLRVVFDESAKVKPDAPSLNECLYTGPSLLPTIIDILLRFRYHRVALVADIEKAFHMLRVSDQDKDSLRFLWVNDPYSKDPELVVLRFLRLIFGLNCSPFLLGASLNHHIRKYELEDPTFVRALLESLYVDDMISGDNEVNSAFGLYMKSKLCLADGGFNLRKWRSSSQKLIELIEGKEANETEHKRPELIEVQPFV